MTKTNTVAKVSGILADGTVLSGTRRIFSDGSQLFANIAGGWKTVSTDADGTFHF